jgi:hypothetical protein
MEVSMIRILFSVLAAAAMLSILATERALAQEVDLTPARGRFIKAAPRPVTGMAFWGTSTRGAFVKGGPKLKANPKRTLPRGRRR